MNSWIIGYIARAIFSALFCAAGVMAAKKWPEHFGLKSFGAYYCLRLLSMFVLVVIVGMVPPDVSGWFMHARWMAHDGLFPGMDFLTPYYLGMNGIMFLSVLVYNAPYSIVVAFTLVEILALSILYNVIKQVDDVQSAKRVIILYVTSPITTMCSWLGAQDETLILLSVAVLCWVIVKSKSTWWFFMVSCAGIAITKILAVFFIQPFCFVRRYKTLFISVAGLLLYLVISFCIGVNPFNMVFGRVPGLDAAGDEIMTICTIGSVWFLFPRFPELGKLVFFAIVLALVSLPTLLRLYFKKDIDKHTAFQDVIVLCCLWGLVLMSFYKMALSSYAIVFLPLLIWKTKGGRYSLCTTVVWSFFISIKDQLYYGRVALYPDVHIATLAMNFATILCFASSILVLSYLLFERMRAPKFSHTIRCVLKEE